MENRIGQQVGNYRLIRQLGIGGYAEVYLGEHIHLNRLAAIKILHSRLLEKEEEQFRKEARIIAQLDHPNIIRVLEFGIQDDIPFLIMEYATNGTLRKKHPKGSQVSLSIITTYVKQVADALQHAHNQKFIHRDVKPENMLIGRRNEIVLSDFGISTIAHNTHSESPLAIAGTVTYMAPEQIRGHSRPASDQYALGIVAYEWLCGYPPFRGGVAEVIAQHCQVPPPLLRQKVPTISREVESVILRALTKDYQRRFATVWEFALALEKAGEVGQTQQAQLLFSPPKEAPLEVSHTMVAPPDLSRTTIPPTRLDKDKQHAPLLSRRSMIIGLSGLAIAGTAFMTRSSWVPFASKMLPPTPTSLANQRSTPTSVPAKNVPSAQSTVYVGSTDNFLYALRAIDGAVLWSYRGEDWMNSRPIVANGVVYAGSNDHNIYALKSINGKFLWSYRTGDKVVSWPSLANGVLYVGSWDQSVYALRVRDGEKLWNYQTGGFISSPAQVVDGVVYIGSGDGSLYALQANGGALLWHKPTNGPIAAQATVYKGVVYIGSSDHSLYAFRVSDGAQLWSYQTGYAIYSAPEIVNDIIYFGSGDHFVYALRISDQAVLWRYLTGDKVDSLPTVFNGVVYIGSTDGYIYALQASNGKPLWHYQTGGVISSKPILAGGLVYVGASNGLFVLRAKDGTFVWKFDSGAITTPTIVL